MTTSLAAALGLAGSLAVLALKWSAWKLTGSVALYSDALETLVNVAAAAVMLTAIRVALRPPDEGHPFGHTKAEHFAVAFEGLLVGGAAIAIGVEVVGSLRSGAPLRAMGAGAAIAIAAALLNGALAAMLTRVGRRQGSPALVADGAHLWTDVLTTAGALGGAGLAYLTGLRWLDPAVALVVAAHILWIGYRLVRQSVAGLMDAALDPATLESVTQVIERERTGSLEIHDLRTRRAGGRVFVELHMVVDGGMTVAAAHGICDRIERGLEAALRDAQVTIHVEPESEATTE